MPEAKAVGFSSFKSAIRIFNGLLLKLGFSPVRFSSVSSISPFKKIKLRLNHKLYHNFLETK